MPPERRLSFGGVAELYEHARPSYPEELVDEVLAFCGAARGDLALEVGAGTGKATRLFASRGLEIVALEPSVEMAAVARRACAHVPHVTIEQAEFERWPAPETKFALVFSAQAWHWISPDVRYARAHAVLRPGGELAAFWNTPDWESTPLRDELSATYARLAPDLGAGAGPGPMHPASETRREWWSDWSSELAAAPGFGDSRARVYRWRESYTTASYLRLLRTHSDHILLGERVEPLLVGVGEVLDRHGGGLELDYLAALWMARASG